MPLLLRRFVPQRPSTSARHFSRQGLLILCAMLLLCAVPRAAAPPKGTAPSGPVLAESERVYLAEIEHRALVIGRKGFAALSDAIKSGKPDRLTQYFTPEFKGQILEAGKAAGLETGVLKVRRITNATNAPAKPRDVNGDEFARHLIGLWERFKPDATIEMAVMGFSPVKREDMNGAYKSVFLFRVAGQRKEGGREELITNIEAELASVPDLDEIAKTPGWIRSLRFSVFQETIAQGELLAEVARSSGIDTNLFRDNWNVPDTNQRQVITGGVYVSDVDDDGREDVLVTDLNGVFLFRGVAGGRFEEVTTQMGLPRDLKGVSSALFADLDNDGFVDLLLDYRVFKNIQGKRFENVTERIASKTQFRFGTTAVGLSVGDYDRDGKLDIYVSRSNGARGSRYAKNSWIDGPGGPGNQLWHNLGDWKFEEISQKANAQAGRRSVFTSAWLDANNDGWPDIYVINEFGGGVLLLNQKNGSFSEVALIDDLGDFGSMGLAVADYDNDGNTDVYAANMSSKSGRRVFENLSAGTFPDADWAKIKRFVTGSEMYRNLGGLRFQRTGKALRVHGVGWAYGAAFLDLDNDGWLDLYGTAGFMSVNKEEPDG